jgi:nicotinate-nucleotide pyrophosphorylase (carboxylating)
VRGTGLGSGRFGILPKRLFDKDFDFGIIPSNYRECQSAVLQSMQSCRRSRLTRVNGRFTVDAMDHQQPQRDFQQIEWGPALEEDWRNLLALAVREDLERVYDWTTVALVPDDAIGQAQIVARQAGVIAGLPAGQMTVFNFDPRIEWSPLAIDGECVEPGRVLVELRGPARSLLTAERTVLNVLGRLSGIATLTRRYVDAVAGTSARIYDTRKTTPGWRRLEKYAVRQGGGRNHRTGLYDAVLIKDNHLAVAANAQPAHAYSPAESVVRAREFLARVGSDRKGKKGDQLPIIEVEVDNLRQLDEVLPVQPDIVLLDNLNPDQLCEAVSRRNAVSPQVELEASGGVTLATVALIAATGIDRISIGALTHSAPSFDVALDWHLG